MLKKLSVLLEQHATTGDDKLILDVFKQNHIDHVYQAIRDVKTAEPVYQHAALRFGNQGHYSERDFNFSEGMRFSLALYSLYMALHQARIQLESPTQNHPDKIVIPIDANALLWRQGHEALQQMLALDKRAFRYLVPLLKVNVRETAHPPLISLLARIRSHTAALWFDIAVPCDQLEFIQKHRPDCVKLSLSLENRKNRQHLMPLVQFLHTLKLSWVAGQVSSNGELSQYRLLGASHYFEYDSETSTSEPVKTLADDEQDFDALWV